MNNWIEVVNFDHRGSIHNWLLYAAFKNFCSFQAARLHSCHDEFDDKQAGTEAELKYKLRPSSHSKVFIQIIVTVAHNISERLCMRGVESSVENKESLNSLVPKAWGLVLLDQAKSSRSLKKRCGNTIC